MTEKEELELAIQDFMVFLKLVWKHLRLPKPTRMQLHIAHYLQKKMKRKKSLILKRLKKN